jgi:hypothetical protein
MGNTFQMEQGSADMLSFMMGAEFEKLGLNNVSESDYEILRKHLSPDNLQKTLSFLKNRDDKQ